VYYKKDPSLLKDPTIYSPLILVENKYIGKKKSKTLGKVFEKKDPTNKHLRTPPPTK
jgi:CRISPR/Cas system CSM-associated protein Csm3 (group 7 of RAMP superfamily)